MSTTITPLDIPPTRMPPSNASHYLQNFVISTLRRKGFDGAEGDTQRLFSAARDYANLAQRSTPNASDLVAAHEDGSSIRSLRKEGKRRRKGVGPLRTVDGSREGWMNEIQGMTYPLSTDDTSESLDHTHEGIPTLPARWTYVHTDTRPEEERKPLLQVTSASLDFVKSTATERGDISPELGLVHYRRAGAGGLGKRKWGVKGVMS
ncbi:MAG: hypothetical protein TREMPRED_005096 [Tremellales sp. Tagirdzhanova-0007]|nr:MAG: hypothetical protein TREMPRED_005096 [Tremellales sp. Tagirdzhanova-0007]